MKIGEILRRTDIDTYRKLKRIAKKQNKKEIELGDRPERLMQHRSYKRVRGALRQIKWE